MKVLFLSSFYCKEYGGAEKSIRFLVKYLERKDAIDFKIFTLMKGHEIPDTTYQKKLIYSKYSHILSKKLIILGNSLLDWIIATEIKKIINNFKPDIIHVHDTYILPAAIKANINSNIPLVLVYHNDASSGYLNSQIEIWWHFYFIRLLKYRNYIILKCTKKVDKIISMSNYIRNDLVANGVNEKKIITIYFGGFTPDLEFPYSDKRLITEKVKLLSFGRIYKYKGFGYLINSIKHLDNLSCIQLNIAGRGPYLPELKKEVFASGIRDVVNFLGYVSDSDLTRNIIESDIVIFPTLYSEPFGRVGLEGSYYGKPVIATNVGGIPESLIDGETGILVHPNNEKEMAEAIHRLATNKTLREKMGENGKKFIRNKFDNERLVNQVIELYEELINER